MHRLREGIKADRTACINRIRGLLLEFGLAVATGVRALQMTLDDILEDASNELNAVARMTLARAQSRWRELDEHLAWRDTRLAAHAADNQAVQRAAQLMGVDPVTASAAVATGATSSSSRAAHSSAPGSAWYPNSTPAAARATWARSPNAGMPTCARC